jgi:hypothetical protein
LHSGYADGTPSGEYFPETHYVQVGDGSAITGILRYYDRQMIFTREAAYASVSESTTDALGRTRRVYPVHLISAAAGNLAVGSACLVGNTPVSVTAGGLCRWQIDSLRDETNATVFTHRIAAGLRRMSLEKLRLFYHAAKERLYIWSPKEFFYVYDGATDSFWRYEGWEPRCFFEDSAEGELYFGTETGRLCRVGGSDDDGAPIAAYWHSSELDLGLPSHSKTLFRAAVLCKALSDPCLRLQWSADVEGRSVPNNGEEARRVARPLFHFGELCFSRLGFLTGYHACNLLFPLRIRRFRRLRLCLKECSTQDLQVESIRLWGRCHDKQV